MGSSRPFSKERKVESTSLTNLFEKLCPIYMSYGMSYDEYWFEDVYRSKYYLDAYKLKVKHRDEEMWIQGMYIYEALCEVSPVLHAFSKNGTKPLPYSKAPYLKDSDFIKTREDKQQEIENERLKARLHFDRWVRDTKKKFENKEGGV